MVAHGSDAIETRARHRRQAPDPPRSLRRGCSRASAFATVRTRSCSLLRAPPTAKQRSQTDKAPLRLCPLSVRDASQTKSRAYLARFHRQRLKRRYACAEGCPNRHARLAFGICGSKHAWKTHCVCADGAVWLMLKNDRIVVLALIEKRTNVN